jgi:hypothetical protein
LKGYKCKRENPDSMFNDTYWWQYPHKPNKDIALFMGIRNDNGKSGVREVCKKIKSRK